MYVCAYSWMESNVGKLTYTYLILHTSTYLRTCLYSLKDRDHNQVLGKHQKGLQNQLTTNTWYNFIREHMYTAMPTIYVYIYIYIYIWHEEAKPSRQPQWEDSYRDWRQFNRFRDPHLNDSNVITYFIYIYNVCINWLPIHGTPQCLLRGQQMSHYAYIYIYICIYIYTYIYIGIQQCIYIYIYIYI